jgi:hypothetical protein
MQPRGLRFKRMRQYRRNFRRMYPQAVAGMQRRAQRYLRVWFWVRTLGLVAGLVALVVLWWSLVLR